MLVRFTVADYVPSRRLHTTDDLKRCFSLKNLYCFFTFGIGMLQMNKVLLFLFICFLLSNFGEPKLNKLPVICRKVCILNQSLLTFKVKGLTCDPKNDVNKLDYTSLDIAFQGNVCQNWVTGTRVQLQVKKSNVKNDILIAEHMESCQCYGQHRDEQLKCNCKFS